MSVPLRVDDGSRRVVEISEVQRMEGEVITLQKLFEFKIERFDADRRIVVLQIGASVIQLGVETVPSIGILVVVGAVVPVLTYAFLASLWFMKVCADQMGVGK